MLEVKTQMNQGKTRVESVIARSTKQKKTSMEGGSEEECNIQTPWKWQKASLTIQELWDQLIYKSKHAGPLNRNHVIQESVDGMMYQLRCAF